MNRPKSKSSEKHRAEYSDLFGRYQILTQIAFILMIALAIARATMMETLREPMPLVRSWLALRLVAGMCLGLLLIYTAHGLIHEFIDVPENIRYWTENGPRELAQRHWAPDSFEARQFEQKLKHGEMIGMAASPNT